MGQNPDQSGQPKRGRQFLSAISLTAVVVILASACSGGGGSQTPPASKPKTSLTIANAVKVDTLDPAQNSVNESIWMDQNIYSRLVQPNADGTAILPDLATSQDISADGLTYTFHIRDASFSDGTPVTAEDIRFSVVRSMNLKGGWGFLLDAVKKVSAPDSKTLVVTLSGPHAPLLADLAMYAYSVLPEKTLQAQGDSAFFQHPIGSGPFMLVSQKPGSELDFAVNPHWYGTKPHITTLKYLIVPNDNARVLLLQTKKVDIIENPPGNLVDQINGNPDLHVDLFPSTRVDFIQLDEHFKPFQDVNVRQALNYGIDRSAIVKLAYSGHAIVGSSYMPYKMLYWNSSLSPYPYDPVKAKALLAKSAYPNGFTTFLIEVSGDVAGQATAVVIKSELAKIGITVQIRSYELLTAYGKEDGGHSQMGQRYWTNDIIDPDEVTTFAVDPKGGAGAFSSWLWNDPTATKLVHDGRAELDATKRQAMYEQIQQIVYDQSPFVVLDYSPYRYASGKWVSGFHVSPLGAYNLSLQTLSVSTP